MSREYHSIVRLDVVPLVPQVARLLDVLEHLIGFWSIVGTFGRCEDTDRKRRA